MAEIGIRTDDLFNKSITVAGCSAGLNQLPIHKSDYQRWRISIPNHKNEYSERGDYIRNVSEM